MRAADAIRRHRPASPGGGRPATRPATPTVTRWAGATASRATAMGT